MRWGTEGMAVYVDQARHRLGRMIMCHMTADTLGELHEMAQRIGISALHFQGPPTCRHAHYDICKAKRTQAVRLGAVEVSSRLIARVGRRLTREVTS